VIVLLEPTPAAANNVPNIVSATQKVQVNVVPLGAHQKGCELLLTTCIQDLISKSNAAKNTETVTTENQEEEAVAQSDFDCCFGVGSFNLSVNDDSQSEIISVIEQSEEAAGFDFSMFDIDPYEDPEMALVRFWILNCIIYTWNTSNFRFSKNQSKRQPSSQRKMKN
jgi:hypothetical protein